MAQQVERRRHPRVTADIPARLEARTSATVRDISRSGVRCVTESLLTPMTLVEFLLELPTGDQGYEELQCRGVVVRSRVLDEDDGTKFEAAILFKDLDGDARDRVESFITSRL